MNEKDDRKEGRNSSQTSGADGKITGCGCGMDNSWDFGGTGNTGDYSDDADYRDMVLGYMCKKKDRNTQMQWK